MKHVLSLSLIALLSSTGCALFHPDSDDDGLTNKEEEDFGTDPEKVDTDGDGLDDLKEFELGTDGTKVDTDGDTYADNVEVDYGSDPTDEEDRIYTGYWPYNPDKDSIEGAEIECRNPSGCGDEGMVFPRFTGPDQFGETVELYDFAGQGKYIILDLSGAWCSVCRSMATWLEDPMGDFNYGSTDYDIIARMVHEGLVYWVTVLDSDRSGGSATAELAAQWYEDYPLSVVPILIDLDRVVQPFIGSASDGYVYYPSLTLLDENMNIVVLNMDNYYDTWDELLDIYPDWQPSEE